MLGQQISRYVRPNVVELSYAEPRVLQLPIAVPEAYVEWGSPSNFHIDELLDNNHGEMPYVLSGHYYEEARKWEDFELGGFDTIRDGSVVSHTTVFARLFKSHAFRGPKGEQIVLEFGQNDPVANEPLTDDSNFANYEKGDTLPYSLKVSHPLQTFVMLTRVVNSGAHPA